MEILEYVFLIILLISAVFIVVAVLLQKSNEDGLSSTISGGSDTFYGKDKGNRSDKTLFKWTIVAGIVFSVAVLAVYVIQPDYTASFSLSDWMSEYLNSYSHVVPEA